MGRGVITPTVSAPAQSTGWRMKAAATFGAELVRRKVGRLLSNSAEVREVTCLQSPPRQSMTTSRRAKVVTQSGLEVRTKRRRVFGNGWTALLSEMPLSQPGLAISRAVEEINIVWSSGLCHGMITFATSRTTLCARRDCAHQVFSIEHQMHNKLVELRRCVCRVHIKTSQGFFVCQSGGSCQLSWLIGRGPKQKHRHRRNVTSHHSLSLLWQSQLL